MAESIDIKELNEKVKKQSSAMMGLLGEISRVIVGQRYVLERMLVGILSDGHILLEGVPGLAKHLPSILLQKLFQAILRGYNLLRIFCRQI